MPSRTVSSLAELESCARADFDCSALDRVAAELQAARSDDIWDDGQEGIKAYLSSRSRYEEQEGEDSNDELHEDENYSSDPSDDEEGEGGTSDE